MTKAQAERKIYRELGLRLRVGSSEEGTNYWEILIGAGDIGRPASDAEANFYNYLLILLMEKE